MSDTQCDVWCSNAQCVLAKGHVGFHEIPCAHCEHYETLRTRISPLASQAFGYQGADPIGALELGVVRLQAENKLARELLKNGPRAAELWAACEEPPDADGVPACGWTGEMSQLVEQSGVTHCPNCGSTAIKEDIGQ